MYICYTPASFAKEEDRERKAGYFRERWGTVSQFSRSILFGYTERQEGEQRAGLIQNRPTGLTRIYFGRRINICVWGSLIRM
jgi:hypothetical protein